MSQSSTGSVPFLSSTLQEATLFSAQPDSSYRLCRFAPFRGAVDTQPVKAVKEGNKEEHHVAHPCIAEQSLPESTTFQLVQGEGGAGEASAEA